MSEWLASSQTDFSDRFFDDYIGDDDGNYGENYVGNYEMSPDMESGVASEAPVSPSTEALSIEQLRDLLANQLCEPDHLKRPEGVATGLAPLDQFLLWGGIPKGALSLMSGSLGTGATSLWIDTAAALIKKSRWTAWINHDVPLAPQSLFHKGMDLNRFVSVEKPPNEAKLFWLLQEMMSSSLFDLIGCDLGPLRLREHQLRKLQVQAREAHVALVLFSQPLLSRSRAKNSSPYRGSTASVFSLILHFEKKQILIERALHRPTPHTIPRSVTYARFTLHTENSFFTRDKSDTRNRIESAHSRAGFDQSSQPSSLS